MYTRSAKCERRSSGAAMAVYRDAQSDVDGTIEALKHRKRVGTAMDEATRRITDSGEARVSGIEVIRAVHTRENVIKAEPKGS